MIHNIVVVDGQEYKAVEPNQTGSCLGCSFRWAFGCKSGTSPCLKSQRDDEEWAIYKPHYKLKHK